MSFPTNTYHKSLYKAAIALNNTAVTLIERQQYRDAMETYRASISAIHSVIEETRNPSKVVNAMSAAFINDITRQLREASQLCARSSIAHNDTDVVTKISNASSSDNVIIVKFSSQQCVISALETICQARQSGAAQVYTCVVIELMDQDGSYFESMDEVCYSIMYNFGVAHSILACQFDSSIKSEQIFIDELQNSAFALLRHTESFFLAKLVQSPHEFHDRGVLFLCLLFLHAMSTVAHQLQYMVLWESYQHSICVILTSIDAQEMLVPTMNRHAAIA